MNIRIMTVLAGLLVAGTATAGSYDGSQILLCAPHDTLECADGVPCARGEANNVNLPDFVEINVASMSITGVGGDRSTKIMHVLHDGGSLILQGGEAGRAWSVTISETDGHLTLAAAGSERAFIVFAACTPL